MKPLFGLIIGTIAAAAAASSAQESGGTWWAYAPLNTVDDAETVAAGAALHPVDAAIRSRLKKAEIEPSPRASADTLLRRATFDLTGLPPSLAERDSFLADVAERGVDVAWPALLDRLFASEHYGEAQARHWLDLVRYAETDGYERDSQKRNMWRYRDWVVRALGADMPYDRFVKLQLAGDEYAAEMDDPREASSARLATGFYRIGVFDDEPADRPQAASDARADIVDTVSQVVFATTMGCARCHDHKKDPITQKEYFQLTAFFRGVTRYSKDGTRDIADAPGNGVLTVPEFDERLADVDRRIEAAAQSADLRAEMPLGPGTTLVADARAGGATWRMRQTDELDKEDAWKEPGFDDAEWTEAKSGFGAHGTPGSIIGTPWRRKAIYLRTAFRLDAIPDALRVTLHYDDDVHIYLNGQRVLSREGYVVKYGAVQLGADALRHLVVGRNVLAVSCEQDFGGQYIDVGLDTGWDPTAEGGRQEEVRKALAERSDNPALRPLAALVQERGDLLAQPVARPYPAHVAYERGAHPDQQFVELRGSVHAQGDAVEPMLPSAWLEGEADGAAPLSLPSAKDGAGSSGRRRALAEWAFDAGAHVTARVAANRTWQFLFGRGLSRTPGDFGRLGAAPSHPELIDIVAAELIRRDWSIQGLQRWLMLSDAYQRSSKPRPAAAAQDPRNELYARCDPERLTAEQFRDALLAASGELNRKRFGPWVYPPLAEEVLATASRPDAAWGKSSPEDAVRRSLYVHVKRSLREPLLTALDQPDPDISCAARFPTNVPTQALLTLNGPFTGERARVLAEELADELGDLKNDRRLVQAATQRTLVRPATGDEIERGADFLKALRSMHGMEPMDAAALYVLGLFNRNEFLWID